MLQMFHFLCYSICILDRFLFYFIVLLFLILVIFKNFFTVPVQIENARLNLALVFPIGVQMTVAKDAIEILTVVTDKTISHLSKWSKEAIYLLSLLLINSLYLISATK